MLMNDLYPGLARLVLLASLLLAGCDSGHHDNRDSAQTASQPDSEATVPAGTIRSGSGADTLPPGKLDIDISGTAVTIKAKAVSQQTILYDLAKQAGFGITEAGVPWKVVTLDIEARDLHSALVALLKQYPYQIIYEFDDSRDADTLSQVLVGDSVLRKTRLSRIPAAGITPQIPGNQVIPPAAEETLSEEDQVNLTLLLDPSPDVREEAADYIEPVGIALDYLAQIVTTDPSPKVRIAAASTLEDSEDPRAREALIQALQDQDPEVLEAVIDALGTIGDSTTIPYLQPFLDDPNEDVKEAAEDAIYNLE